MSYLLTLSLHRLLKGRSVPGKVSITRRSDPSDGSSLRSPDFHRSFSDSDTGSSERMGNSIEVVLIIGSSMSNYMLI